MRNLILTIILLLTPCFLFAQGYSINGTITDGTINLSEATVTVLNAKDSIIVGFAYTNGSGAFNLQSLPAGNFIALVTYPDYADYVETFTLDESHSIKPFGNINLQLKSRLLQEVQIKATPIAVRMRGDTTIYDARAYVIQPNSKVEDLLKQLPDIQVDRNGKITAQGTVVQKVLLDGEEFFGDDPLLITRNIRADMVDKVLAYDKKSDQAAFTGIDDGVKIKTIDIKLKEDSKNGVFGKIIAGIATGKYDEVQGIYNRFKQKMKMSAYATTASNGKMGLGFNDNSKIGTNGSDVDISESGGISINTTADPLESALGRFSGHGFPIATTAGIHYDNKSADDSKSINTNYKLVSLDVSGTQNTLSQLTLPSGVINSNQSQQFNNSAFRQKLDATYQVKFNPTSTLKFSVVGYIKNMQSNVTSQSSSTDFINNLLLNQNSSTQHDKGEEKAINATMLYTKKFAKPGRTFSWYLSETYNKNDQTGFLYAKTTLYNSSVAKDSVTDQYKPVTTINSMLNSNITVSEQLSKLFAVAVIYAINVNNSMADRESYNLSAPGKYDVLDAAYSSNYTFNQLINQGGLTFNYKTAKTLLNFGTKLSGVNFVQTDRFTGQNYKRNFLNWAPMVSYWYHFTSSIYTILDYKGSTIQPTLEQIQPIRVNNDPLNIFVGNAGLSPSFLHSFNLSQYYYSSASTQKITFSSSFSFTENSIANSFSTNPKTGISTIQYVNLTSKEPYNYSLSMQSSRIFKPLDVRTTLTLRANGNIFYSYINGTLNKANNTSYSASFGVSKSKENKYDLYFLGGPVYTINQMSLQPNSNNNAFGSSFSGNFTLYLPWQLELSSDASYDYKAKTQSFTAQSITLLNATIGRTFFKEKSLKVSIRGNDLLNQNLAVIRNIYGNNNSQTTYTGIKRYFMLTLSWDFTKFKPLKTDNQ